MAVRENLFAHRRIALVMLPVALVVAAASAPAAAGEDALYAAEDTWAETMRATRARYLAYAAEQGAQAPVILGPWHVTPPLRAPEFGHALFPEKGVDLAARDVLGNPIWTVREAYADGIVHDLPGRDAGATYLYRTLQSASAATVRVSLGSDDGLALWLNGERVISRDVARVAAPNQDEAELELRAGENAILLKIYNRTGGHGFYFQLDGNPLPVLCARIAADFPRESEWFRQDAPGNDPAAWFRDDNHPALERDLLQSAFRRLPESVALEAEASALENAPRMDPRWLDIYLRVRRCAEASERLASLDFEAVRRAVEDLAADFEVYAEDAPHYRALLDSAEARAGELRARLGAGDADAAAELDALAASLREPLLANPLLDFEELLLVKRGENMLGLPQNWQGNCSMPSMGYDNEIARMNLATGELATFYRPEKAAYVGDVDLHWDAGRMLFTMPGEHGRWHIWEIGVDGAGLRQVTPGAYRDVDHYDACYLPDDRVIFGSTGCFQGIPCVTGSDAVANLHLLDPETGGIRQLCFDQDHNWYPAVLNNGRVMFTRWEYSDTPHYFSRLVFHMNPDGTNQVEYYGSNSFWPNSTFYARPIPGHPTQFVAIVSGHHGVPRMGELIIFDPALGRFEADGVVQRIPGYGEKVEPVIMDELVNHVWPKFLHPYPLSGKYFLVSCKPDPATPWGLYLVDIFDNMTLLKEIPGYALFEPLPLRPTPRPPIIPDRVRLDEDEAVVYLADVYAGPGLRDVPRGKVKALRIYEFHYGYPKMGGHEHVAVEGGWDVHRILGTVPVFEDGSAIFQAPANMPIAVQPLDEQGRALQLMRSWFTAMPGEVVSCVGCHESQNQSAPPRGSLAALSEPAPITPWRGPARGFSFKRDLQPVLNKYCTGCHDGTHADRPDFAPKAKNGWKNFTPAYLALHPYVRRPGPESDYRLLQPLEYYADTSELVQMLEKGHHGVQLDAEAWDRLYTWIDLNVPDHGTWGEHASIAGNFHQRRLEMRAKYANRPEDPEHIPELPPVDDAFIQPAPVPEPVEDTAALAADGWPFPADQAALFQAELGEAARRTVDLGGIGMDFALVPAGEFVMGSLAGYPDERPRARVRIERPFWMGVTEVTLAQYLRFNPRHDNGHINQHHKDHTTPGYPISGPDFPVVRVTWDEAMAFCDWLSRETGMAFTLPTEAQWEWACRAGSADPFHYGGLDTDFGPFANLADASMRLLAVSGVNPQPIPNPNEYQDFLPKDARFDDGQKILCEAGLYRPNAWGLQDMHGNAAEWTLSAFHPYPYAEDGRNDLESREKRAVRGGSWRDRPKHARAAFRLGYEPWRRVFNVGFRVVCLGPDSTPVQVARRAETAE